MDDVCRILELKNVSDAVKKHVPDKYKTVNESFTVNGTAPILINEAGMYKLVMRCYTQQKKPASAGFYLQKK